MVSTLAASPRADVYSRITAEIVAAIENGADEWCMPWHHDGSSIARPRNIASDKGYRGINILALWVAARRTGYTSGIWAQFVVVVEILIAKRNPEHPLADQRRDLVLDQLRAPHVVKARCQPIHHSDRPIRRAQKQRSCIRRDRARVEYRDHRAAFNRFKSKKIRATLCRHQGAPLIDEKLLQHNGFR